MEFDEANRKARVHATRYMVDIINNVVPAEAEDYWRAPYASLIGEQVFQNVLLHLASYKWAPGSPEGEEFFRRYYADAMELTLKRWRECPFVRAQVAGLWEKA